MVVSFPSKNGLGAGGKTGILLRDGQCFLGPWGIYFYLKAEIVFPFIFSSIMEFKSDL